MIKIQTILSDAEARAEGLTFAEVPVRGGPAFSAFCLSLFVHALGTAGALLVPLTGPVAKPKPPVVADAKPTVIRIADHLYYVNEIDPPERQSRPAPKKDKEPATKAAGERKPPPIKGDKAEPKPVQLGTTEQAAAGLRQFIPPDAPRNPNSDVSLVQPLLPPAELSAPPQVPTMVIATAEMPTRLPPKPFVVPGRQTPKPPDPRQPVLPPNLDLMHTEPAVSNLQPFVVLPANWPAPADAPPPNPKTAVPPPIRQGDPVEIVALNPKPVPPKEELVVPPGNIIGRSGDGNNINGGTVNPTPAGPKPAAGSNSPNPGSSNPSTNPGNRGKDKSSDTKAGESKAGETKPADGTRPANAANPSANPPTPSGTKPDAGIRATVPPKPTSVEVTILGSGVQRRPASDNPIIIRPADGTFDTVIVQNSPLDQMPETRGILTGRPIYTVYFSLATAKDWTFYFCASKTMTSDTQAASAIQPPYPTKLVRPQVDLPSYYKNVVVYGSVNAEGRFENLKLVKVLKPEVEKALLAALSAWEFRAATRDGAKTAVDFVLSIPIAGL